MCDWQGIESLEGQLRAEVDAMVAQAAQELVERDRTRLARDLEANLHTEFDTKQSELSEITR